MRTIQVRVVLWRAKLWFGLQAGVVAHEVGGFEKSWNRRCRCSLRRIDTGTLGLAEFVRPARGRCHPGRFGVCRLFGEAVLPGPPGAAGAEGATDRREGKHRAGPERQGGQRHSGLEA